MSENLSGFRMPGEWEAQKSVWIAWPYNKNDWPGLYKFIPKVILEIIYKISKHQKVNLIINGNVDGEINCESLEIGPSGVVTGTVKAGQCFLAGKLEGKLSARVVNILSTGDLNGRLSYGKLEIESGANIALKLRKTKQLSDTPVENLDNNEEM